MLVSASGVLRQYAAAVSAGLSTFIIGTWVSWPSSAVKHILAGDTPLDITPDQVSWAVALLDVGNIISPVPASYVVNRLGRKSTLVFLSVTLFITWLLTIFGTTAYYLYTARTIVGLSKGLIYTILPIYLGEIASTRVRGSVGTIFGLMMGIGMLFELLLGSFVSYETLNIISSPFPIVMLLLLLKFPETPYFLLMKGQDDKAKKSLAWFRSLKEDSPSLQQELAEISTNVSEDLKQSGDYKDLVATASARRATVISVGLAMLQRLTGCTCMIVYSSITLPPTGGYFSPEVYMVFFAITSLIGQLMSTSLIDKWGRKPLLIVSSAGCAFSTGVSAFFYWYQTFNDVTDYNWVPYFSLIFYSIVISIGLGIIPPVITVELFPSTMRTRANAVTAISYALSSFITNKTYLHVKMTIGVHYMFLFFMICSIIAIVFTCTMVFETKGMTFLEIQNELKKKSQNEEEKFPVVGDLDAPYGI